MNNDPTLAPLVRWDGIHLAFDIEGLQRRIAGRLEQAGNISGLRLSGFGDALRISAIVSWGVFRSRVTVDLAEIRVKRRFVGIRLRSPRVLSGVPVPRAVLMRILQDVDLDELTVLGDQGIVVMDMRQWLAPGLDLNVLTVQTTRTALHVWLGPGELRDLPAPQPPVLPEGEKNPDLADFSVES